MPPWRSCTCSWERSGFRFRQCSTSVYGAVLRRCDQQFLKPFYFPLPNIFIQPSRSYTMNSATPNVATTAPASNKIVGYSHVSVHLVQVGLGGGVWRMKWHPEQAEVALIACMQNGFAVVALGDCPTVYSYPHQKVLGYGADWVCSGGNWLAATCSFYDKSLHLWQYDPACLLETGDSSAV